MNSWQFYNPSAEKLFRKLDRPVQRRIIAWLDAHIEGCSNPRAWGRALEGEYGTLWRYRVGDYRVAASINDTQFLVLVVKTGHRGATERATHGRVTPWIA